MSDETSRKIAVKVSICGKRYPTVELLSVKQEGKGVRLKWKYPKKDFTFSAHMQLRGVIAAVLAKTDKPGNPEAWVATDKDGMQPNLSMTLGSVASSSDEYHLKLTPKEHKEQWSDGEAYGGGTASNRISVLLGANSVY